MNRKHKDIDLVVNFMTLDIVSAGKLSSLKYKKNN